MVNIILEGSDSKNVNQFTKKLKDWKNQSFMAIARVPSLIDKSFDYIQFHDKGNDVVYESLNTTKKIKNTIQIHDFPESHELFDSLSPRLYFDDNQNIKVRAKTILEGLNFLHDFLKYTIEPRVFKSFSPILNDNGVVYVGQSFLGDRLERAVVKITLNILFHYFPNTRANTALKNHIDFVNNGSPRIVVSIEEKNDLMDSNNKTHNVFIHQFKDNIRMCLSLFNGQMIFNHIIPRLKILKHNEYYRFVNDYKGRKNRFESRNDMLKSFADKERTFANRADN